ncbi:MAG TPA: DUF4124 domain-containing protein [Burkholderiales bacterium]|nr:DUF4124 domain-containing protein [Burkholderiales bacterium]
MRRIGLLIAALGLLAGPAHAEVIYKYRKPDGSLVYSNSRIDGATLVETLQVVPATPEDRARFEAGRAAAASEAAKADAAARERVKALDAADAEVKDALDALKRAQANLERGIEPLPGEVQASAIKGHTHFTPDYLARQQALKHAVAAATVRLEKAYAARDALR